MGNIIGLFNTGRLALSANQSALLTTGNNIANVNTPGYTRQRAVFEALSGGGVKMLGAERLRDKFLDVRLRDSNARLGARETISTNLQLLETALTESDDSGVSRAISDFFSSLQSLTTRPSGSAERFSVRSRAELLATALESASREVTQVRQQVDEQIRNEVNKINTVTEEIATINSRLIAVADQDGMNMLFDQRDRLIDELSHLMPIKVIEDSERTITILADGGVTLVESTNSFKLDAISDGSDNGFARIVAVGIGGANVPIESRFSEGSLGGLLQARDIEALQAQARIDKLGAELVRTFNVQHRLGTGLDGVSGRDFFTGLDVTETASFYNRGGASISGGTILDESLLTFHDYEIRFTGAATFDVVDASTGAALSTGNGYVSGAVIAFDGMEVTITDGAATPAAGDVFRVNSYFGTADRIGLSAAVAADAGAIAAGLTAAPGDNQNALAMAALKDIAVLGPTGSQTFEEFHIDTRSGVGLSVEVALNTLEGETIAQLQLAQLADSAHNVSIDEEATSLVQYERAFQAASRIITSTDELIQTVLGMI